MKQMEIFLIAAVFLLGTAIILIYNTMQREQEFLSHTREVQKSAVNGAAIAIERLIKEEHHLVRLFVDEYKPLINHLIQFPNDEKTRNDIKLRLQQRFTDFFTFTITDPAGTPVLTDIESLVGEACQLDLRKYAKSISGRTKAINNKVFIHPQPFHYHYDVMTPLYNNGTLKWIFFASFHPNDLSKTLKTHEIPGQNLMLVKQSDPELIEATRAGARDQLNRQQRLSKEEMRSIVAHADIDNSEWRLINLPERGYVDSYLKGLWKEALIIMLVVTGALLVLIVVLGRLRLRRRF